MFWEYINKQNRLAVSLYFNMRKSQQIDVKGLYDALNILEELESCRSSIAVPQVAYIFVLKFYCNPHFILSLNFAGVIVTTSSLVSLSPFSVPL